MLTSDGIIRKYDNRNGVRARRLTSAIGLTGLTGGITEG